MPYINIIPPLINLIKVHFDRSPMLASLMCDYRTDVVFIRLFLIILTTY